jgi:histidine ammonia-lyase
MRLSAEPVGLAAFCAAIEGAGTLDVAPCVVDAIEAARAMVDAAAAGEAPVYGLNTGLGANLGHRLALGEIAAFQAQLIAGRAVAVGAPLAPQTGRAMILARLVSARTGHSGMSLPVFQHLCAVWRSGLSPCVPRYGSIGGGDLTQNAAWAQALIGGGQMFDGEALRPAGEALAARGLTPPDLQPKDAMALINHGGLTVGLAAVALREARIGLTAARAAALLS